MQLKKYEASEAKNRDKQVNMRLLKRHIDTDFCWHSYPSILSFELLNGFNHLEDCFFFNQEDKKKGEKHFCLGGGSK